MSTQFLGTLNLEIMDGIICDKWTKSFIGILNWADFKKVNVWTYNGGAKAIYDVYFSSFYVIEQANEEVYMNTIPSKHFMIMI